MRPPPLATACMALARCVPALARCVPALVRLVVALTLVVLAPALLVPGLAHAAESPVGYWTTIDDDGKPSSVIQIFPRGKKLYGKIVQLINPREKDPKCTACEGKRKNQRIIGMEILRDFEQDDDEWSGGHILDPRDGTEYNCYLEVIESGKRLKVRGYVGIALLGRTQYWRKSQAPAGVSQ